MARIVNLANTFERIKPQVVLIAPQEIPEHLRFDQC